MKNPLRLCCFDVGDESACTVQQSAIADNFTTNTGRNFGVIGLKFQEAFPGGFFNVAEIGKRLLLGQPVGGLWERKRDGFEALGHDEFHVMIEANITVLAQTGKRFSVSGNAPAFEVTVSTDRKHGGGEEWMTEPSSETRYAFSVTGKFTSARKVACGIFAGAFVTTKQQSAGTNRNEEVVSVASCVHVPKLRLGETHVPVTVLARREKTLPVAVKFRYARY